MASVLTHERLLALLHYDRDTGVFTWLQATARRITVGGDWARAD